jgi:histidinol phosphatase-like enzyme
LLKAAKELEIDLSSSYMVGDGIIDMVAGQAAGTRTVFINSRKCYVCDELIRHDVMPHIFAASLTEAVNSLESLVSGNALPMVQFALPRQRVETLAGEDS